MKPPKAKTILQLIREGFRRFRRPHWNPDAYLQADDLSDGHVGPWLTLVDPAAGSFSEIKTLFCDQLGDDWIGVGDSK